MRLQGGSPEQACPYILDNTAVLIDHFFGARLLTTTAFIVNAFILILIHLIISRVAGTDGHGIVDRFVLISFQNSTAA